VYFENLLFELSSLPLLDNLACHDATNICRSDNLIVSTYLSQCERDSSSKQNANKISRAKSIWPKTHISLICSKEGAIERSSLWYKLIICIYIDRWFHFCPDFSLFSILSTHQVKMAETRSGRFSIVDQEMTVRRYLYLEKYIANLVPPLSIFCLYLMPICAKKGRNKCCSNLHKYLYHFSKRQRRCPI
jgi:hypothetical protein